jgi:hypothetical protein
MNTKTKAILAAILVLLGSMFGWYVAWSDGDETTKPDTTAVIDAGKGVYDAATADYAADTAATGDAATTAGQ